MNADLEEQLAGLGPGYRRTVDRLLRAAEIAPRRAAPRPARHFLWAASALLVLALAGAWLGVRRAGVPRRGEPARRVPREYALAERGDAAAVREIIATQRPDGGWGSDFLTRRNADALSRSELPAARVAYKRALRNLRVRGLAAPASGGGGRDPSVSG